jgi:hypothetical protein
MPPGGPIRIHVGPGYPGLFRADGNDDLRVARWRRQIHTETDEAVEELLSAPNGRIGRIVLMGHATPADEWYDSESSRVGTPRCRARDH